MPKFNYLYRDLVPIPTYSFSTIPHYIKVIDLVLELASKYKYKDKCKRPAKSWGPRNGIYLNLRVDFH